MKIRIFGQAGELKFPFESAGPWNKFLDEITFRGNLVIDGEFKEHADALIANTHNSRVVDYALRHKIPKSKRVLIKWEPKIVDNVLHEKDTDEFYGKIYCASPKWVNSVNSEAFYWPQDSIEFRFDHQQWARRKNKAIMIQGNKFSARKGELYSLRRRVLKGNLRDHIDLYGTNWNKGFIFDFLQWFRSLIHTRIRDVSFSSPIYMGNKYSNFRGPIADKNDALENYQIALVIENSADFVSEKIFDAVRSGCLVIYVGPNLADFGLPHESIISVKPEEKYITGMIQDLLNRDVVTKKTLAKNQIRQFAKISENWENHHVLSKLGFDIAKYLSSN